MAGIGDFEMPRIDPVQGRRVARVAIFVVGFLLVISLLLGALKPYIDYLWFAEDLRHPEVFTRSYSARLLLFFPAFIGTWALLYLSLRRALSLSLVYLDNPSSRGQVLISNTLHFLQDRGAGFVKLGAPIFAFFSASSLGNEWMTMLLAQNGQSFGKTDPLFGLDLSFFVFTLPWYRAILNYAFGVLLLTTLLTVGVYAALSTLASIGRVELNRPGTRGHVVALICATALVFAGQVWLRTYEFGLKEGQQFTGAGYTGSYELVAQRVCALLLVALAIGMLALMRSKRVFEFGLKGAIGLVLVAIVALGIVPSITQRVVVEPDKLTKEGPFASRAISMTRFAYGLDRIRSQDFPVQATPSPQDLKASKATLDNMRLWDPEVVRQSIEVLQGLKPYYTFNDVDIDRYSIKGRQTEVMISARDIRLEGLSANARTWINEKLQYTHGFGITMSSVNSASPDGEPTFLIRDIPPTSTTDLKVVEPRIYFSDYRDEYGQALDEYVLVGSNQPEFDYPAQEGEKTVRWSGDRGIPVGSFFRRLALSISLGDGNLLVSGNITGSTRLLLHRGVIARCERLFPFLRLDNDPYIVLNNGKLYWILDAYTWTDRIPYSERSGGGANSLNYIRNSVKIVVDAYSGETAAYAIEPDEPIIRAYRAIYPNLIRLPSELPAGLREHFRYPEDMFRLQAGMLCQYHVTDPTTFLNNNDAWELPRQFGGGSTEQQLPPYYVQMRLPGEPDDGFVLMLPFTPRSKANMSGWLAAHCDPQRYGEMVLYNFAKGANVAGAEQMETTINSDPKVNSAKLQLQGGGQTDVVIGNMLVIPIGSSVMYAESLFPKSRSTGLQAMPRLKKVVLALNGRVEIGDTYSEALERLFGATDAPDEPSQPSQQEPSPTGNKGPTTGAPAQVRDALKLLDQADAALRAGDFAKYGDLQKRARARLRELIPSSSPGGASSPQNGP